MGTGCPPGNATTYAHYANTQVVANPCATWVSANQRGRLRLSAAPSPDGGPTPAWTTEVVYDAAGRVVASRRNADPWTCLAYDARGRPISRAVPALPAPFNTPARTVASTYVTALGNDPRTATVSDPAGTITATGDLLGRGVSYTDALGSTTTSVYDQPGRLTDTATQVGLLTQITRHSDYDAAGRVRTQLLDRVTVADATYDGAGELASVTYGNGTALSAIGRDGAGRTTALGVAWGSSSAPCRWWEGCF